jgi:Putative lumazine-binding
MKSLALGFSVLFFFGLSTNAQNKETPDDDASAVRSTVTNYIEAYYAGNAAKMEQTLHPHYLKHMIHGDIPIREKTRAQMVAEIRKNGPADLPSAQKNEQVTVLDIVGDLASVKLVTPGWTDYMTLSKVDGAWKILSVVQRID